jgi:choline dehydrogenase-like flavoprotein
VNDFGRAHDVPNLSMSGGSMIKTGAAADPTIVALAFRQADHIEQQIKAGAP